MISVESALSYSREHYPNGPEKLAEKLGVEIRRSPLSGCDGWCLAAEAKTVIRINSNLSKSRHRFTLAHELGHLLLGVPSVVGESLLDMLRSNTAEERHVNEIAAELLLPAQVVRSTVTDLPVVASVLKRLARQSGVSELSAALRVANLAVELGLHNASVVFFENDTVSWQWSQTLTMKNETAVDLRKAAQKDAPKPYRHAQHDGKVIVASVIENPFFGSATLFVQLLPPEYGNQQSRDERRRTLEEYLFADQEEFRRQLQGCLGAFKPITHGKTTEQAEAAFRDRYADRFAGIPKSRFTSDKGREYIRLRIEEWCEHRK